MNTEGPSLEALTHRLSECPADFLAEPRMGAKGVIHVPAVVSDLLRDLGGQLLDAKRAETFQVQDAKQKRNWLRTVLIAAWLLHDPWFRNQKRFAPQVYDLLALGLDEVSEVVEAGQFVTDPDRREELARLCLGELGLRPAGESEAQAQDRLTTLNSVERQRVIVETQKAQERARQIMEALKRKAAESAAAKVTRE